MAHDFESLYGGVNERSSQLIGWSAEAGMSRKFRKDDPGTFPWAMAYSPVRRSLLEINDGARPNDNRTRYLKIFPVVKEDGNYIIPFTESIDPATLLWSVSADGTSPKDPRGNVHSDPELRPALLELIYAPDLLVVPFENTLKQRARSSYPVMQLSDTSFLAPRQDAYL